MQETRVQSLSREDLLEKGMATHSSVLAWRIPWTEDPAGLLQTMESQRAGHDWMTNTFTFNDFCQHSVVGVTLRDSTASAKNVAATSAPWVPDFLPVNADSVHGGVLKVNLTLSLNKWFKALVSCVHAVSLFSHVQLFATLWTVACQVPLSMGLFR